MSNSLLLSGPCVDNIVSGITVQQVGAELLVAAGSTVGFTVGDLLRGAQVAMKTFWPLSGQDYFQDLGH